MELNNDIQNDNKGDTVIDIDDNKDLDEIEGEWKSCCFVADISAVKYFSTLSIIIMTIIFCFVQLLINDKDKDKEMIYLSLLSSLVFLFVKPPEHK